jgi:hypothetical protein
VAKSQHVCVFMDTNRLNHNLDQEEVSNNICGHLIRAMQGVHDGGQA